MERILAIAAVGTMLAPPAFAQQYYAPRHESRNPNPDYQLGSAEK
jgi:hypothetical protein